MKNSFNIVAICLGFSAPQLAKAQRPINFIVDPLAVIQNDGKLLPVNMDVTNALHQKVDGLAKQAKSLIMQNNFRSAELICRSAIAINDKDPITWLYLAESLENQGKQEEAIAAYRTCIYPVNWGSNVNFDPSTRLRYVLALTKSKIWQEALAVYAMAMPNGEYVHEMKVPGVAFNLKRPEYTRMQAVCHLLMGYLHPTFETPLPSEQEAHLKMAIKLQPNNSLAYYSLGQLYQTMGKSAEAKAAFQKAAQFGDGELKKKSDMMLYTFPKAASPKP